ncbi:hypothetical protein ACFFQW_48005 [Umezawaea endophytica]|uniref:Uncharacterized protein n=1 Tax=Umezawaea endophytica TaxID=1654476 RepID=A0A9X3A6K5_9PSEU|nr:hypothetical protein [Umezawaea endophytica]MCS7483493.1 hypothetical protein [Umezawaea endophytica]
MPPPPPAPTQRLAREFERSTRLCAQAAVVWRHAAEARELAEELVGLARRRRAS